MIDDMKSDCKLEKVADMLNTDEYDSIMNKSVAGSRVNVVLQHAVAHC